MGWSIEEGYSHKCHCCGKRYTDSDGGCDCVECSNCGKEVSEDDNIDFGGLCQKCYEDKNSEENT